MNFIRFFSLQCGRAYMICKSADQHTWRRPYDDIHMARNICDTLSASVSARLLFLRITIPESNSKHPLPVRISLTSLFPRIILEPGTMLRNYCTKITFSELNCTMISESCQVEWQSWKVHQHELPWPFIIILVLRGACLCVLPDAAGYVPLTLAVQFDFASYTVMDIKSGHSVSSVNGMAWSEPARA